MAIRNPIRFEDITVPDFQCLMFRLLSIIGINLSEPTIPRENRNMLEKVIAAINALL